MKLSKEYIIKRLQTTSVHDLAVEIAEQTAEQTKKVAFANGYAYVFDMDATITKFEKMIQPFAPKEVKATDLLESMGIHVVRVA